MLPCSVALLVSKRCWREWLQRFHYCIHLLFSGRLIFTTNVFSRNQSPTIWVIKSICMLPWLISSSRARSIAPQLSLKMVTPLQLLCTTSFSKWPDQTTSLPVALELMCSVSYEDVVTTLSLREHQLVPLPPIMNKYPLVDIRSLLHQPSQSHQTHVYPLAKTRKTDF